MVHQLGTTPAGPTATGSRTAEVETPGVRGSAPLRERLGSTLG